MVRYSFLFALRINPSTNGKRFGYGSSVRFATVSFNGDSFVAVSPDVETSCGGTARYDAVILASAMIGNHALTRSLASTTESVGAPALALRPT
ncbi:hypothetical protein NKJ28_28970 [Mesorhizobium sp. M0145]|uniref:hypothetical protein n=1 Tax=Mesorhizobium sp. M0145 TaxID=2956895 RepID=UPI003338228F